MKDADLKFSHGEYFEAAGMYKKIYRQTKSTDKPLRGEASFKMGECYRLINNVARANAAYASAIRNLPEDSLISLQYARTLHKAGNYAQAAEQYKQFLEYYPDNKFAMDGLAGIELAARLKKNPTRYTVRKMDIFNSRRSEFSPMLLPPEYENLYFTSSRDDAMGDNKSAITGLKNNDIFMSRKDENKKWMKPEAVSDINTEYDEGVTTFTATGNTMYYTFCMQDPLKPSSAQIYASQRSGGAWGKGAPLQISRDTVSVFAHPAIDPSGAFLYFVSDMPGGYGGKDIWRAYMIGDKAEYFENLGEDINTAGDELFPYMRNDSVMYFSSDGHPGLGGMDIFKARFDSETKKWSVENMGVPINSAGDDFGMTFEGDKDMGFFSSNRNETIGADHIYSFEYPTVTITLEGFVVDKDDEFISDATIHVVGIDGTNEKFKGKPDGTYRLQVAQGTNYVLLANAPGYLNTKMDLYTLDLERDTLYYVDFVLRSINKPNVLENIFYDFDKAALRDESQKELDELINILEINPNVTIELSAHTDRKGSDEYNNKLSQRRAQSVVDYLVAHGIVKERLQVAGYGKTLPKIVSKNIAKEFDFLKEGDILTPEFIEKLTPEQQEIADQVNRRTEFKVLSITYNLN
ncbi:peptidoglycan-associated lipoprotein [Dysgonomonas sp. PH5-45]|uniref:PorE family type IX secretion system protein n=1 Tax=unclassified Dysgonomonas TaxID=2630389 RepID=UPI0024769FC7|nr:MULTISPECIES: OmpA family protein [unclassified Dysgonomonas]MDH6354765.1 peptidoglycan-associated lipoprotein [Dysgonomonas sp. PH5-45]